MKSYKLIKNQKVTVEIEGKEYTYVHPVEYIQDVVKYHHGDRDFKVVKLEKYEEVK